eukprot:GFUD01026815.1.p1 GENE.GFUD01026815.1~~GFUD01026815.1.p1  ORF type:complete len:490 (-),score=151.75 GFUD01026815.1:862-2331(-)
MASGRKDILIRTLPVPISLVGQIIGKKGANIKEINDRSGARCWVDNTKTVQGCKVLEITGDLEAVTKAKRIIESQLGHFKMQNQTSRAENGNIPGLRSGKKGKKKKNRKAKPEDFEREQHNDDIYNVSDEEEDEEVRVNNDEIKKGCSRCDRSGEPPESLKVNVEERKERERKLREEDERLWDKREVTAWTRANMWGLEESKIYSVGCATTAVCSSTGRVELLSYQRLAEIGTKHFKMFKEQLEKENYELWTKQAGEDWRQLMMKANTAMEKNLCKATANYNAAFHGAKNAGDTQIARSLARNLLVSYSYLATRVRESCRMDVYCQAVDSFKLMIDMGGNDHTWLYPGGDRRGVVDIFVEMVEDVGMLLPSLGVKTREMVQLGEKFMGRLDRWTTCEEERKCLGLARLRQGEAMFNKAAMAMGEKNYTDALYLFQEMYSVVEEARRLLRFPLDGEEETLMVKLMMKTICGRIFGCSLLTLRFTHLWLRR